MAAAVRVLTLEGDTYQDQTFAGADKLVSPSFAALALTAEQILTAGLSMA
jgi:hypothetical protein